MKKILFYINAIHHGGAEHVMVNLANKFVSKGYECILVTSFTDSWEYPYNSDVKRISLFKDPLGNFIIRNILLIRGLRKIIKSEKPDTVLSFMAEPNFRTLIACCGLKVKKVISVRNDPKREYGNFLKRILAKIAFRFANFVIFQTEDAQKWFPKAIQKKSDVILNPVENIFFDTHYDGERHDIVSTGRLVPQKNHELLIKAFSRIANKTEDNLFIYGDGPLEEHLNNLIKELKLQNRVFLPGAIKNVAGTIKSAKIFVLSSNYEGLPNSLMEAMALGLFCISSDCPCGGPKMLLNEEYLFQVGDIDRLSTLLLQNKTKKSKPNYLLDVNSFKIDQIVEKWEKVLG